MREALVEEMQRDEDVFVVGEDVRIGGVFHLTLNLVDEFGLDRVIDTPISEAGFTGLGVGAAIEGMRPIVDFQYGDFVFTAMDQLVQQASKLRYMSGGQVKVPLVTPSPHRRVRPRSTTLQPDRGLLLPDPRDQARNTILAVRREGSPQVRDPRRQRRPLLRSQASVRKQGQAARREQHQPRARAERRVHDPARQAAIKRAGEHVTVVANMLMLHRTLNVAAQLEEEGLSVEVIDPRCLIPFDLATIVTSRSRRRVAS